MAMQTVYLKEHEGSGLLSSVPQAPWWNPLGSHSVNYGSSCAQLKPLSMEDPIEGNAPHFTLFPGNGKKSGNEQKPPSAISLQSALPENHGCFELGFGQPMICAKYPHTDQFYGVFSTYGPQIPGRVMLPLNLATDDGPIYVNAKQYHGIIRRRKSRAKAVLENKLARERKQPYMHYSRHLHAMRRPRGCGGRFLNKKKENEGNGGSMEKKGGDQQLYQPTGSQSSEVLQSESGTLNSSKEANCNGSNLSGSEVTSMYFSHLGPSVHHSFSGIMDNGCGIVMPTQWIAAADNCCNLEV